MGGRKARHASRGKTKAGADGGDVYVEENDVESDHSSTEQEEENAPVSPKRIRFYFSGAQEQLTKLREKSRLSETEYKEMLRECTASFKRVVRMCQSHDCKGGVEEAAEVDFMKAHAMIGVGATYDLRLKKENGSREVAERMQYSKGH